MSDSELACVYSALILHDAGINITVSEIVFLPSNKIKTQGKVVKLFPLFMFRLTS